MNFGDALYHLKITDSVARSGWEKGKWISLVGAGLSHSLEIDLICLRGADSSLNPWVPSQADLLADDWLVLDVQCITIRLAELAKLEPGWLNGDGDHISLSVLNLATLVTCTLVASGGYVRPGIYPTPDGGILLEWQDDKHPTITIDPA